MNKKLILHEDWFTHLIEQCDATLTERIHNARWEVIQGWHEVGRLILESTKNFERHKIYGKDIVQRVAESLGKSQRSIYYALKFFTTFPDINSLPDGKSISWNKITKKLLTGKSLDEKCEHEKCTAIKVCDDCHCRVYEA